MATQFARHYGLMPRQGIPSARLPFLTRIGDTAAPFSATNCLGKVVGVGSAGLDYLAQVAAWPKPDDKLRTESLETHGGGNCANALTAAARLGLQCSLVSKIGDDGVGDQIIAELQSGGVQTDHVLQARNAPSPFTYIIVDRTGGTRTCIHTPSEPLEPSELEPHYDNILRDATLIYFDGRLTEGAIPLAKAAKIAGIPVLVEAERLRPNLEELLAEASFVSTSAKFPHNWTGEEMLGDALVSTFHRLPSAEWVFTTLGLRGAVLLQRAAPEEAREQLALQDLLRQMWEELDERKAEAGAEPACTTANGVQIRSGAVVQSGAAYRLQLSRDPRSHQAAASRAELAAAQEAQRNASESNAAGYKMHSADPSGPRTAQAEPPAEVFATVIVSSAAQLAQDAVKDTTGAGDASVGTLLYGICQGMELPAVMKLAAVVSAAKCTGSGARSALPYRTDIVPDLLS